MRTVFVVEGAIDGEALDRGFEDLAGTLVERLARDGADPAAVEVERFLDCRYVGQGYELRIPVPEGPVTDAALAAFHAAHRDEYGHAFDDPVEIVNLRVTVRGRRPKLERIAVEPGTGARADGPVPVATWRVDGRSSSCPRRTSTARRSSPASRSPARPSCCSSTPPSPSHRDGRPRRRRRASCSSPTPEGPAHERHDGRRPDHDRRHRRGAHVDRGRHGLPPDPHVVLVDHPRVRGLRLRDLRPRAPSALRVDPVDAAAVRAAAGLPGRHRPALRRGGRRVAPRRRRHPQPPVLRRVPSARRRDRHPDLPRRRARRVLRDDGAPPRPRRAHARDVRHRRRDGRVGRGPPAQRGQGRGGGAPRPLGLADPGRQHAPAQARRRRPRGAGRGRAARGRPHARARAPLRPGDGPRRVRAAHGPVRAGAAPRDRGAPGRHVPRERHARRLPRPPRSRRTTTCRSRSP